MVYWDEKLKPPCLRRVDGEGEYLTGISIYRRISDCYWLVEPSFPTINTCHATYLGVKQYVAACSCLVCACCGKHSWGEQSCALWNGRYLWTYIQLMWYMHIILHASFAFSHVYCNTCALKGIRLFAKQYVAFLMSVTI